MSYKRSMLEVFAKSSQKVLKEKSLEFPDVLIKNGCSIKNLTNTTIELSAPGVYWVSVDAVGHIANQVGEVGIQLFRNSEPVPYALSKSKSTDSDDTVAVSFACLITVKPSCCAVDNTTYLTVDNIGEKAIFENANIAVIKIA